MSHGANRAHQGELKCKLPLLLCGIQERPGWRPSCIRHQGVKPAKALVDLSKEGVEIVPFGDVRRHSLNARSNRSQLLDCPVHGVRGPRTDHEIVALAGE